MTVDVDSGSGFCFGVVTAIRKAEEELEASGSLYCLGDIVHNAGEVERLRLKGLRTITHAGLETLSGVKVLLRAHGEPPSTYVRAAERNIEIIDATCPVVLQLQRRIKKAYDDALVCGRERPQIVIYGKTGHAEVNGLVGQTGGEAVVIQSEDDLCRLDYDRDILLYSQTTKSPDGFAGIVEEIKRRMRRGRFEYYDTICRQVANRMSAIREFAASHEVVVFVSGEKSSNGRVLYAECLNVNPRTYLISNPAQLENGWFDDAVNIGVTGATSTPLWLMEQVADIIRKGNDRRESAGV